MVIDSGNPLGGISLPAPRPEGRTRPIEPISAPAPVGERPSGSPRYAPYGPDRPTGRGARAVHAYETTARAGRPVTSSLAGLDCYA